MSTHICANVYDDVNADTARLEVVLPVQVNRLGGYYFLCREIARKGHCSVLELSVADRRRCFTNVTEALWIFLPKISTLINETN